MRIQKAVASSQFEGTFFPLRHLRTCLQTTIISCSISKSFPAGMDFKEDTAGPKAALKHDLTPFSKLGHITGFAQQGESRAALPIRPPLINVYRF